MNTLVNQILDALRHESIAPSRVAIAWRQEEGQYGYVLGEGEPEMLSFCKLKAQNLLFADIFAARPDIHVVIRSSPSYVEAASSIRNLRSFRPPIDDAAQIIGTRIVLEIGRASCRERV